MTDQNETDAPQGAHMGPQPAPRAPYVREQRVRKSAGTIDDYAEEGEAPARMAHDSGFTERGPIGSGRSYRRTRSDAEKLRRDLQYGQYLEVPKGRRDIFVKRERTRHIKTFIALVVVLAILAVVVYFLWGYMQTNWGPTS